MAKFGISQPVKRIEDTRFLTGTGRYTDDLAPRDALCAVLVRSPIAHGRITALETGAARAAPGVRLVLTAADLEAAGLANRMDALVVRNRDGSPGAKPARPILAEGRVRFAGEPVALVVAETQAQARDAAELVELETEDLPVWLELAPGGAAIHEEAPDNLAYDWAFGDADATEAAFARAAHTVALQIDDNRVIANPLEPRGCIADWDGTRLHLQYGGQGVWGLRLQLAKKLGLAPEAVHVSTPDVGGGFGMKAFPYPEYFLAAAAARALGRPVRWIADRSEAMLSDNHGRDLTSRAEAAFDAEYRLLAYRVHTVNNLGAYNSGFGQNIQTNLAARVLTGAYAVDTAYFNVRGVYTNTTQVDAYRGAGRPEAIYVLERLMDHAARRLGVDPWDIRRRNFIPRDAFPYKTVSGELYDVGAFAEVQARAAREAGLDRFADRRAASHAAGRLRGVGLCYYIEAIMGAPNETTKIEFTPEGTVRLYVGTQSNGQGHETSYVQILHEFTGIDPDCIEIVQGDSDRIAEGGGTGGSRSVTTQGNSIHHNVGLMLEKFRPFVAGLLEADAQDISFAEGTFHARGSNRFLSLVDAAAAAREAGRDDLLITQAEATLPGRSFPNGAHVAEVEIDPQTGRTAVLRYTVVDDLGVLMNPALAEGQVHGGVAQGIGQALCEEVGYDADGQLLSGSFMDYAMPRATDAPFIDFHSEPLPSTANPLGMKGCGEAGTVGALAAVANAVQDALWDEGVRQVDMPCTPLRVWSWLSGAALAAE
ncbi:xanthine dehydrogenase family protein molybdopterin-binding subunit [Maritimibacter sp. 55A14]|uniref:xanthine dehydrogenase family protein molybdopterin-binding subunit n=1 Tax=Maritimibacter sp. 55A14 TaxID=2174844 RepID=UPI0018EE84E3|nr:xanthine dehydrogenase family protein molybdopterin-binding subunit [Maritimibacter sp. 55A14]